MLFSGEGINLWWGEPPWGDGVFPGAGVSKFLASGGLLHLPSRENSAAATEEKICREAKLLTLTKFKTRLLSLAAATGVLKNCGFVNLHDLPRKTLSKRRVVQLATFLKKKFIKFS